jgi:hypothetical protein
MTDNERKMRLRELELRVLLLTLRLPRGEIQLKEYVEQAQEILDQIKPLLKE